MRLLDVNRKKLLKAGNQSTAICPHLLIMLMFAENAHNYLFLSNSSILTFWVGGQVLKLEKKASAGNDENDIMQIH